MQRRLISLDWAIKKLLRSKANFGILEGFLSELLFEDIEILEILESESNQELRDDKYNRVDLKVKNQKNEIIIIELQYATEYDYLQRILYGTSKVITEHIKAKDDYSSVVKVISVNILYFDLGIGKDYIYKGTTTFKGIHNHDELELNEKQKELYGKDEISRLYPEYYLIKVKNFDNIAKDTLDEWIYFLKNEDIKDEFSAKGIKEAKDKLDIMKLPKDKQLAYNRYIEDLMYQNSLINSNYGAGKIEGIKEGIEKGEKQAKIEIAKKSLSQGIDLNTISLITGLSVEEIKKLK
jgi:predicted transposase/invertase (TIGR01784 family)